RWCALALTPHLSIDLAGPLDLPILLEPADARLQLAADIDGSVRGTPQLPVRVPDLLHPGVVRVRLGLDLVVCRLRDEEQLPAARPERSRNRGVVDALAERNVPDLLVGLRREHVGLAVDETAPDLP